MFLFWGRGEFFFAGVTGARVSELFLQRILIKKFFWGEGGGGKGDARANNFFFFGGGGEGTRVSDFFTKNPNLKKMQDDDSYVVNF